MDNFKDLGRGAIFKKLLLLPTVHMIKAGEKQLSYCCAIHRDETGQIPTSSGTSVGWFLALLTVLELTSVIVLWRHFQNPVLTCS